MSSLVHAAPVVAHNLNLKAQHCGKKIKFVGHMSSIRGRRVVRDYAACMLFSAFYNLIPDDAYDWEDESYDEFFGNNL